jgi:hypothetical protein
MGPSQSLSLHLFDRSIIPWEPCVVEGTLPCVEEDVTKKEGKRRKKMKKNY